MHLNPYLFFDGNCEEAFTFYEKCLGGKIEQLVRHAGTPAEGEVPPEWLDKVLHVRLTIGENMLMGSDAPPGRFSKPQGFSISVIIADPAEAERTFKALAAGGTEIMPFTETFWAQKFGMLFDRFGVQWMVNCPREA